MQPGYSRSATFTISNTGNTNLSYSITAAEPSLAGGASLAKTLSNFANVNPHRLPKLDLAAARTPLAQGVTSVLFTKSASAANSPAASDEATDADVLVLDDANNSADTFVGMGSGSKKGFTWANEFSLHEFGFRLESFDFYMRTELVAVDTFYFAVMDTNGQTLAQGSTILPASINGGWYRIPLPEPLTFNADSSFIIVVGVNSAIGFPAGTDVDASVPEQSFYFEPGLKRYMPLNAVSGFENGAFLIRANGSKAGVGSRLSVSPASGMVAPGASQTITVTFDAQGLAEGKYYGHLNLTSNGGEHTVPVAILVSNTVHVDDHSVAVPAAFQLEQNYPNPFNPETSIRYVLPHEGNITLAVFDLNGRRVASLESGLKTAGQHVIRWNGRDSVGNHVPSGVYFYRLEATSASGAMTTLTKKMTVMK
ncbi:T9SS type A sorting domain-containing protein [candidate division KSB1 bacterium]|nr:T9SS type A sorting domain-containing protein [candidate division KSB1 bacterium]